MAKSLRRTPPGVGDDIPAGPPRHDPATEVGGQWERLKWFLWQSNVFCALQTITDITTEFEIAQEGPERDRIIKAIGELDSYIHANAGGSRTTGNAAAPAR